MSGAAALACLVATATAEPSVPPTTNPAPTTVISVPTARRLPLTDGTVPPPLRLLPPTAGSVYSNPAAEVAPEYLPPQGIEAALRQPALVPPDLPEMPADEAWITTGNPDDTLATPEMLEPAPAERRNPWGPKKGFLQRIYLQESWLPNLGGEDALGLNSIHTYVAAGIPLFSFDSPLIITPGFQAHFTEGPVIRDVPPRLYDTYLDIRWMKPLGERWKADIAVTPGVYGDFAQADDRSFRLTGRGFAVWQRNDQMKWILGVVYLNRPNLRMVPAVGLVWQPNDDFRADLIFPQPRLARRIAHTPTYERWVYLGAELGGGAWAVERAGGGTDVLSLNDWRWRLGFEHLPYQGWKTWYELAYVSLRTLEYESELVEIALDDTFMLRAGLAW